MEEQLHDPIGRGMKVTGEGIYSYVAKCRGASHVRENKACQDAYACWNGTIESNPVFIMAMADGHGAAEYDLSEYGAEIAVDAAIEELKSIYRRFSNTKNELLNNIKTYFPDRVVRRWKEEVLMDVEKRDAEYFNKDKSSILKRYGTTLQIALICPEGVFIGKLGDGDLLIVQNENTVEVPIEISDKLIANVTHSMISSNAAKLWQIKTCSLENITLIMMSTDGLSNSFQDDRQFHIFAKSIYKNILKYGADKITDQLPEWLEGATKNGSGDDITLMLALVDSNFIKIK